MYREYCSESSPVVDIPEFLPLLSCVSSFDELRINLIVPSVANEHFFGGASTAVKLLTSLSGLSGHLRIIATEQSVDRVADQFRSWAISGIEASDVGGTSIALCGDRYGKQLPVSKNDVFIATAWWTAVHADQVVQWQASQFGKAYRRRFLYFIQDFEPGFYPWSTRYVLAQSTYSDFGRFYPLFNSHYLKDFFASQGFSFDHSLVISPSLSEALLGAWHTLKGTKKERIVLVYGRPSVSRNGFELVVSALRLLITRYDCSAWRFISVGEAHASVSLGAGVILESLGKVSLEDYGHLLARSSIGFSLMFSPHPSYPPLEMVAFGCRTVTNNFHTKDLSKISSLFRSVPNVGPESLTSELELALSQFGESDRFCDESLDVEDPFWRDFFKAKEFNSDVVCLVSKCIAST
jgi:hypothetical protein